MPASLSDFFRTFKKNERIEVFIKLKDENILLVKVNDEHDVAACLAEASPPGNSRVVGQREIVQMGIERLKDEPVLENQG